MRACLFFILLFWSHTAWVQSPDSSTALSATPVYAVVSSRTFYGIASYYADKFTGRKTATGASYAHGSLTAACNQLPLGTWLRVTNLRNGKTVIVQVNDRLHPKNKRVVDLSKSAAEKLGYISRGLTQVKVEVIPGPKRG